MSVSQPLTGASFSQPGMMHHLFEQFWIRKATKRKIARKKGVLGNPPGHPLCYPPSFHLLSQPASRAVAAPPAGRACSPSRRATRLTQRARGTSLISRRISRGAPRGPTPPATTSGDSGEPARPMSARSRPEVRGHAQFHKRSRSRRGRENFNSTAFPKPEPKGIALVTSEVLCVSFHSKCTECGQAS